MSGRAFLILTCLACAVSFFIQGASGEGGQDLRTLGIEYRFRELKQPRPNRVHILRVDLAGGKVAPAVVVGPDPDGSGPAEAALTDPLKLARQPSVLAFINTNPWDSFPDSAGRKNRRWHEGQPVDIHGLAVADGTMRSPPHPGYAPVWVNERGRLFMGSSRTQASPVAGMAGFQQIVRRGNVVSAAGGPLHPRTAIGVDRKGTVMWLVVVDGRQKQFSEGMSLNELGRFMLELGCWHATNMDGGGSSIMGLAEASGKLRVVNSPSDRALGLRSRPRPLPMILTIQKTPASARSPSVERESAE